jgi:selenocysteine lyase/cysteine desulfurase
LEDGTLHLPGIMGLKAALDRIDLHECRSHELRLMRFFSQRIKDDPHIRILGSLEPDRRVGVFSIDFLRKDNAEISFLLEEEYGILTRCGLHCAPDAHKAFGTFPKGTVRFSFSPVTTVREIEIAAEAIHALS